jgi:hypothetical protein
LRASRSVRPVRSGIVATPSSFTNTVGARAERAHKTWPLLRHDDGRGALSEGGSPTYCTPVRRSA